MMLQPQEKEILVACLSCLFFAMVMIAVHRADYILPQVNLPVMHLSRVKTGDLLLFSTSYEMFTDVIKLAVGCPYVHVGIAFIDAAGEPYVFEVCTNGRGNQMNSLRSRLSKKNENVIVRPLNRRIDGQWFESVALTLLGCPYSYDIVPIMLRSWLRPVLLLPTPQRNKLKEGRVCTQLVADMYEKLGVFDMGLSDCTSDMFTPKDFSETGDRLPVTSRYYFKQEFKLYV